MTSRTPIRLTPHRGPLATPSTSPVASPESSPTSSTPPTDISHYSTASSSVLDVAILQHRISTLNPITRHDFRSRLLRRRREVIERGLYGRSVQLTLAFENLVYSACDFANTLAGIVTFCLFIWGLLEWVFNNLLTSDEGAEHVLSSPRMLLDYPRNQIPDCCNFPFHPARVPCLSTQILSGVNYEMTALLSCSFCLSTFNTRRLSHL